MSLRAKLIARAGMPTEYRSPSVIPGMSPMMGVARTPELLRVVGLPRRVLDMEAVPDLTPVFQKPGGTMKLWPIQSAALLDMEDAGGLLAPIGVGHGKTLISLLAPIALDAHRAVLLVPAQTLVQLKQIQIPRLVKHFDLPLDRITIVPYSKLSIESGADILDRIQPDAIIADEAHYLKHTTSARTKRFLRYMRSHPGCRFVALSGTITQRSLRDYAHLSELALRARSPVPGNYRDVMEWAEAIDIPRPGERRRPAGALEMLCMPGEDIRSGFRRRLVETTGVVATGEGALGVSLNINAAALKPTDKIKDALRTLYRTWEWDGEELTDGLAMARVARTLVLGFFYRWRWPGGVPDREWLQARKEWHRELRAFLQRRAKPGLDSPMLVARACMAHTIDLPAWYPWDAVRRRPDPPVDAVWFDTTLIDDVWKHERPKGSIIWYEHRAVGEYLDSIGTPVFAAGADVALAGEAVRAEDGAHRRTIACSIRAHATGKNLQPWSRNYVLSSPASGATWEQLLGRTHRPGQRADEVDVILFLGDECYRSAFDQARADATYIEETTGQKQKLNYATITV